MAVSYIYKSPPNDLAAKLGAQTGLSPTWVKTAYASEICVDFAAELTADEKTGLDDFLSTRGLVYDRTDATAATTATWDAYDADGQ